METPEAAIELARSVATELSRAHCTPLLIGATALAAHGYPRQTEDIDFAIAIPPRELEPIVSALAAPGRIVDYEPPDPQDPLGGVITISKPNTLPVQVINFDNSPAGGFPALVRDALARSAPLTDAGPPGHLPMAEDLILFKLYAGGPKSELDILELLTRARVDLDRLRITARGYGMSEQLEHVLAKVKA